MNVKILCPCGTKYSFEVEPVNGEMPGPVQCPVCGGDGTELGNDILRNALKPTPAPASAPAPVRVLSVSKAPSAAAPVSPKPAVSTVATPAPGSTHSGRVAVPAPSSARVLSVAGAVPREESGLEGGAVEPCPKHPKEPATEHCAVCGKAICPRCMEQFGFLCSVYCQEQAERKKVDVPVYRGQKRLVERGERAKGNRILLGIAAAVVCLIGFWIYYSFVLTKPHLAYSIRSSGAFLHARWLGADRLLTLSEDRLAVHEATSGKELWNSPLSAEEKAGQGNFERDDPRIQIVGEDIWVAFRKKAVRFDSLSGKRKLEFPYPSPAAEVKVNEASVLLISAQSPAEVGLTRLSLASGQAQTERFQLPQPGDPRVAMRGTGLADFSEGNKLLDAPIELLRTEVVPAETSAVLLSVRLLEANIEVGQKKEEAKKPSVFEKQNLKASDSTEAAQEFMREGRGGPKPEDDSRYQVTLKRFFVGGAPEWKGEVRGRASVFPQKTVDVLVAGKAIHVFNRNNQKLWEGKLEQGISSVHRFNRQGGPGPCVELGSRLFVFDRAMLNAFDLKSGQVLWRLPAAGASHLQVDKADKLYLASAADSFQAGFDPKAFPVILKVDPVSGTVLWERDKIAQACFVSGKFVYATRASSSTVDMFNAAVNGSEARVNFRILRLEPKTGQEVWAQMQARSPVSFAARQNYLMLQYPSEVRVLKFL